MAIAFDSTGNGSGTSISVTNNAGDFMFVVLSINALGATVSLTYNGVSMSPTGATAVDSSFYQLYSFYLIAPATGTHTLAISTSVGSVIDMHYVTYSGTKQSGQPDAKSGTSKSSGSGTTIIGNVTTIANNCWTAMYVLDDAQNLSAGTGSTLRGSITDSGAFGIFDSNGAITPAGSHNMVCNTSNGAGAAIIISIAPLGTAYTISPSTGYYNLTGESIVNNRKININCSTGYYSLTGISTTIQKIHAYIINCATGFFNLIGKAITMSTPIHSVWTQKVVSAASWTIKTITPTNWTGKNQGQ